MKKHKKLIVAVSVLFSLILAVAIIMVPHMYIPQISDSLSISSHTSHQPEMVAHRGLSGLAPQNTVPAVELSVEYGYDGCEIDIHTTKDGKWVVIHNDTVDAMTDGEGKVSEMTYEEIRKLKIDSGNNIENYENLKVPTLEEVLDVLEGTGTAPVIEIKNCDVKYLPSLKEIIGGYDFGGKLSIISFNREYLQQYRKLDPKVSMMLLVSVISEDDVNWCVENDVDTVNFYYFDFYKSIDGWRLAKQKGLKFGAWTVDNTVYKDVMVLLGADIITTNKLIIKKGSALSEG